MKIKKIDPQQLVDKDINYKEYRKVLKPALKQMLSEHNSALTRTDFIVKTNFEFSDLKGKKMGLIIMGDFTADWKKTARELVKEDKKNTLYGTCNTIQKADGTKAVQLFPEKGSPKKNLMIKQLEKFALKGTPFSIELAPGGELENDDHEQVILDEVALPDDENEDGKESELTFEHLPEPVRILAMHLKNNDFKDQQQKDAVISKLNQAYKEFDKVYNSWTKEKKALNIKIREEFDVIAALIDAAANTPPVMKTDELKALAGSTSWGFSKSNYDKILLALEQYHRSGDAKIKQAKLHEINVLIAEWEKSHPEGKRNKDELKRYAGLMQLKANINANSFAEKKSDIKEVAPEKLKGSTKLFDEKAGTSMASERAKQIAEATVDDRAIELARLLKQGKASDNDANFGAVMKWLTDSTSNELSPKYSAATKKIFGVSGILISDLTKIFGLGSLRSKYLIEILNGNTSPYANTALALGLLGKAWFSTEAGDAFEFIEKNLNINQIKTLLDPETRNQTGTFEGAIAKKLQGNKLFESQLNAIAITRAESRYEIDSKLLEINVNSSKYKYVSPADYYLCTTYLRLNNTDKFAEAIKKWVSTSTEDDRSFIYKNPALFNLLQDKTGLFGLSKSNVAYLKSILFSYKTPVDGKESAKVLEQLEQIAERQKEKSGFKRWKEDKSVGEEFKKVLFGSEIDSPQEALVFKFCSSKQCEDWKNTNSDDKKKELLEVAVEKLKNVMTKADIHADKVDEILDTVYSDGARANVYNKVKDIVKAKTKIGASGNLIKALEELEPGSKEIVGIKNDIELLRALKVKALQGAFKTEEDRERWRTAMKKLGLPPTDDEIAAETDSVRKQLLTDLKNIADTNITEEEDVVDNVKTALKTRVGRNKILTKEQIEEQQKKESDLKKTPGYWASKMATEYKKGFTGRDDHRLIQMAYESRQNSVDGAKIMEELSTMSPKLHSRIQEPSFFDFADSASILKKMLVTGKDVSLVEILKHAKKDAFFKKISVSDLKVMTDNLDERTILTEWFDIDLLKKGIEDKKIAIAKSDDYKKNISNYDPKFLKEQFSLLDAEILKANNLIMRFDIKKELLDTLEKTAKADRVLEFKKSLREKLSAALGDQTKSKELQAAFKKAGIDISDNDIAIISASIKELSNLEYEVSLETGTQWSSLSSRMLQRDLAASKQLKEGWKGREKIHKISKLTNKEREAEEQLFVNKMRKVDEELVLAQEKFAESKSKYDGRVKTFVSIVVTALKIAAAISLGVPSAAMLIKLAWATGTTLLTTMINEGVAKLAKGNNYGGVNQFVTELIANEVAAVMTFSASQVLYKLNYSHLIEHLAEYAKDETKVSEAFIYPLKVVLKKLPAKFFGGYADSIYRSIIQVNEEKPVPDATLDDLKNYTKEQVKSIPYELINEVLSSESILSEETIKIRAEKNINIFEKWEASVLDFMKFNANNTIQTELEIASIADALKNPNFLVSMAKFYSFDETVNFDEILEKKVNSFVNKLYIVLNEDQQKTLNPDKLKKDMLNSFSIALEKHQNSFVEYQKNNKDQIPENINVSEMNVLQLVLLEKNNIKHNYSDDQIRENLELFFTIKEKTFDAFMKYLLFDKLHTDIDYNRDSMKATMATYIKIFNDCKAYFEVDAFADEYCNDRIKNPYIITNVEGLNLESAISNYTTDASGNLIVTIPKGLSLKEKFEFWTNIQNLKSLVANTEKEAVQN